MGRRKANLAGKFLGDFLLDRMIGEGSFSWVYRGATRDAVRYRAFKIAKPRDLAAAGGTLGGVRTRAMECDSEGITYVHPLPAQLLALQSRKLQLTDEPAVVRVEALVEDENACYSRMELLEGRTLRQLMDAGCDVIAIIIAVARSMDRLSRNKQFVYHGDLTPDNIIVTASGPKLIDPGYFGPMQCEERYIEKCLITTPIYYPLLEPDDLLALGLITWEAVCGSHPLKRGEEQEEEAQPETVGDDLSNWVHRREVSGKNFITAFLRILRPREIRPELSEKVESILLRAVRLKVRPDGVIDRDVGYRDFAELAQDLETLRNPSIA